MVASRPSDEKSKLKLMEEAGRRVLAGYQDAGIPFALFLSSWDYDNARRLVNELTDKTGDVQVRIGLERQLRLELKREGLETLAVYHHRIAQPSEWPSLTYHDDHWKTGVEELVRLADLIVVFWGISSDGVLEELALCDTDTNRVKTVVIYNGTATDIFLRQIHRVFPRIVPLRETGMFPAPLHDEITLLVERMKGLKTLASPELAALIDPTRRVARFPFPPVSGRFDRQMWITRSN
jgi:hypothetical protein